MEKKLLGHQSVKKNFLHVQKKAKGLFPGKKFWSAYILFFFLPEIFLWMTFTFSSWGFHCFG
jgi:hypothetical protein